MYGFWQMLSSPSSSEDHAAEKHAEAFSKALNETQQSDSSLNPTSLSRDDRNMFGALLYLWNGGGSVEPISLPELYARALELDFTQGQIDNSGKLPGLLKHIGACIFARSSA